MTAPDPQPPEGFEPLERDSPLLRPWQPLLAQRRIDRLVIGLFIAERHCNSRGTAHGGLIAALADQAMGQSAGAKLWADGLAVDTMWTTSMTLDYLGTARLGQWLTFDTHFVARAGRQACHTEADIAADGRTVARARGAFRLVLAETARAAP